MILNKLVEYCKQIGKECNSCPHFGQCLDYSESIRNAPVLDFTSIDEEDGEAIEEEDLLEDE